MQTPRPVIRTITRTLPSLEIPGAQPKILQDGTMVRVAGRGVCQ